MSSVLSRLVQKSAPVLILVATAQSATAKLTLEGFWVRAMPPTQTMTAAYGRVINRGEQSIAITGASSAIAQSTSLHESRQSGDQVRMLPMGEVVLESGDALELTPGGAHLMLMGIETMPAMASQVEICIHSQGAKSCTAAPVQREAAPMEHHHH